MEHLDGSRSALFPLGLREAVHLAALFHENLQIFELGNDSETEYFTFSSGDRFHLVRQRNDGREVDFGLVLLRLKRQLFPFKQE